MMVSKNHFVLNCIVLNTIVVFSQSAILLLSYTICIYIIEYFNIFTLYTFNIFTYQTILDWNIISILEHVCRSHFYVNVCKVPNWASRCPHGVGCTFLYRWELSDRCQVLLDGGAHSFSTAPGSVTFVCSMWHSWMDFICTGNGYFPVIEDPWNGEK